MALKIPQFIDLVDLEQIKYDCFDHQSKLICSAQYDNENFKLHNRSLNIPHSVSEMIDAVSFTIWYSNQTQKTYHWTVALGDRVITSLNVPTALIRVNNSTIYQDVPFDRQVIANLMQRKFRLAKQSKDTLIRPNNNLVYYTCNDPHATNGYLQLLIASIQSVKRADSNFDVVVICDRSTQQHLQQSSVCKLITDYHVVTPSDDPIDSSLNKMRIFDYADIDQYNKVLFLDCDTIAVNNVNAIFERPIDQDKLYTVSNPSIPFDSFRTLYHGLHDYSDRDLVRLKRQNQKPFNAGQFLFVNTRSMREHFANTLWLLSVWPGPYFFEQSFMNHYFCGFSLTDSTVLAEYITLVAVNYSGGDYVIDTTQDQNATVLHFIGPALNATAKLQFQKQYMHAFKLRQ